VIPKKSIDFLIEHAGPVIQYRLRKEILKNITPDEKASFLAQIYQTPYFKLVESYAKPNGFIGNGVHGHSNWRGVKYHETPLQDGETAARLLCNYAVPKEHPLIANFIAAMRDDEVLHKEVTIIPAKSNEKGWQTRFNGIHQGGGLMTIIYTLQCLLGYGDDGYCQLFQDISLSAFASIINLRTLGEIIIDDGKHRYIESELAFPCMYHLETLAHTKNWRNERAFNLLSEAVNYMYDLAGDDDYSLITFKLKNAHGGYIGGLYNLMSILPFTGKPINRVAPRKLLTALAMCGVGRKADCVRVTAEYLEQTLTESPDGALRISDEHGNIIKGKPTTYANAYGEVGYEDNLRKKTAYDCEMTFWAVQFLTLIGED